MLIFKSSFNEKARITVIYCLLLMLSRFRECLRDVGLTKLHQVYNILDKDMSAEQQEVSLVGR